MLAKAVEFIALAMASILAPVLAEPDNTMQGLASWYGSGIKNDHGLHGKYTATGEVFDPSQLTCATRNTPLRQYVLVTNTRNGRWVWCRVNDRGPYGALTEEGVWFVKTSRHQPGRWRGVIDLSRATALALDFDFNKGLEEVKVQWH